MLPRPTRTILIQTQNPPALPPRTDFPSATAVATPSLAVPPRNTTTIGRRSTTNVPTICDQWVMNKNLTEIAFILDRSGSMQSVTHAAISGFNHFLRDQQAAPGQALLTLVLFDDEYLVPAENLPVQEVVGLNTDTYVPRNSTALLDAIGTTIERMGTRLANTLESDRPAKVIVAILTDGLENASEKFTWKQIAAMIRHQTDRYAWEFLFLGANQDAIATAANLSIAANNASAFAADAEGVKSSQKALSRKAAAHRAMASGLDLSAATMRVAAAPMSEIVAEEDRRERGEK